MTEYYSPPALQFNGFPTHHTGISLNQEQHREFPQHIIVSVTYYLIFTVFSIKGILKMVLRTSNLGTNFAVR